jgi:DNA (cytosine-5)-methyltransferase 1
VTPEFDDDLIVDLFGGPGGWDEGLYLLDRHALGIEWDDWACRTRAAAGHATIRADVATIDPARFAHAKGVIASPPCQGFSSAGKGAARNLIPTLLDSIQHQRWYDRADEDPRVWLIVNLGRWVTEISPEWYAFEQVPSVLPLWYAYAAILRERGYSAWCGVLNSADYGIPQTRERAILMASRVKTVHPPEATHGKDPVVGLFGTLEPWVTMAQALGWGMTVRPANTMLTGAGRRSRGFELDGGAGARRMHQTEIEAGRFVAVSDQFGDGAAHTPWYDPETRPSRTVTGVGQRVRVGFPRLDDTGESEDGYRERDWRDADLEPAQTVTEKARSWRIDVQCSECAQWGPSDDVGPWHSTGCSMWSELVVATGMNSMSSSRDVDDMVPYERSVDQPAPTVSTMSGGAWSVGPPGHRQPPHRWKVNTGNFPAGDRDSAQTFDPETRPAFTLTAKSGGQWHLDEDADTEHVPAPRFVDTGRDWNLENGSGQTFDATEQPAPTVTALGVTQWMIKDEADDPRAGYHVELRRGGDRIHEGVEADDDPAPTVTTRADRWQVVAAHRKAQPTVRTGDEPAPTLSFGHAAGDWLIERVPDEPVEPVQLRNTSQKKATVRTEDEPAPTLAFGHAASTWMFERPSTTLLGDPRAFPPGGHKANDGRNNDNMVGRAENAIRLTIIDALILQSFDPRYPVQGTKTKQFEQIGNAIPPLLAYHVLSQLL